MRDDDIFADAIALPAAERAAFLDRACAGDAALRARVEALLAGYDAAERFLEESPVVRPAATPEEAPGDVIGNYTLLRKLGDGGCGVVYLAEQSSPVRRKVALKIIKLGMDTLQVIARFEAERQALAMMDHADIARVFDAGATATGRPFFVMEFVDGVPITTFCDQHNLTMAERLELFARVCLAMQHAHQKGIIHRDVKPSNVLVTMRDGVPAPKVIDFGIAKATEGRLTDMTLVTGLDQFIGTPAYMSPEQAERRDLDIDTRSDVYSLGVLLYELLAGRPPYDPKSLVRAGIEEIRRIIREVDPPRPSTAVATLTDADRTTVANARRAGPAQLTSVLAGDLDWIVMRCLEKDRGRRYGTASDLAEDVRRHLRREPVQARPPERWYRLQRFVARNRLACASAAAVALAVLIGAAVSAWQAVRATRAERVATAQRDVATVAQADALRRQEQAENLLTFMLGDFRAELKKIGRLQLLDEVGEQAMAYFAAADPRDLTDSALTRQATALTQIGQTRLDQARYAEAEAAFRAAYERAAALAARYPDNGDMLFERAQAEFWLGFVARRRGESAAEREWMVRYRDSAVELVNVEGQTRRAQEEVVMGHHNLAVLDLERGNVAGARQGFEAELKRNAALQEQWPDDAELKYAQAAVLSWLGFLEERAGNLDEALARFTESERLYAGMDLEVPRWRLKVAQARVFMGDMNLYRGRREVAGEEYDRAAKLLAELVKADPDNQVWLVSELSLQVQRAAWALTGGDVERGREMLDDARERLTALVATEATARKFVRHLAAAWRWEAWRRLRAGERSEAAEAVAEAMRWEEPLINEARADLAMLGEFAQSRVLAGRIATTLGNPDAARAHWKAAVEMVRTAVADSRDWRLLDPVAQALLLLGEDAEARMFIGRLREIGYEPIDPLAASTLDVVDAPQGMTPNP